MINTSSVAQLVSAFGCYFITNLLVNMIVTERLPVQVWSGEYYKEAIYIFYREFDRVVKVLDLRPNGTFPRGFEPHSSHKKCKSSSLIKYIVRRRIYILYFLFTIPLRFGKRFSFCVVLPQLFYPCHYTLFQLLLWEYETFSPNHEP